MAENTETIAAGDLVWLKSGGPRMTVKGFDNWQNPICVWFTKEGTLREETFSNVVLSKTAVSIL